VKRKVAQMHTLKRGHQTALLSVHALACGEATVTKLLFLTTAVNGFAVNFERIDRRRFVKTCTLAAGSQFLIGSAPAAASKTALPVSDRWFPKIPVPRELWVLPFMGDLEEGMILESAAGLAARAVLRGKWDTLIYEDVQNDGYERWFAQYLRAHEPKVRRMSLDEMLAALKEQAISQGYILYRLEKSDRALHSAGKLDESANVATSLAASTRCMVVSERLVERVEKLGFKLLVDARDLTESRCLAEHAFSREVVGTADPKTRNCRSLMIALDAFVCSGRSDAYDKALARCEEDVPVLGWGCEAEDTQTITSSKRGLFQTATNWCHNLTVFCGDSVGNLRHPHPLDWSQLDWGDGAHYVNFTLSDGDNVQWVMGNFAGGNEAPSYYSNPNRGRIPFGWGLPVPSLCQLSPRTLAEILSKATPNDDFIQFSGGGYFYPDLYGKSRGDNRALERHAERLRHFMEMTDIRVLAFNFQDWDGPQAMTACKVFASKLPGLLGILAFQYYPYSAGNGAIRWVQGIGSDQVPIVSCRETIWALTGRSRDTTPAGVAAQLNQLPVARGRARDDCFSWVMAHAWSRFRRAMKGAPFDAEEKGVSQDKVEADTARGYDPVLWAAERLKPEVKVVTVQDLLMRVRMRLRPETTLSGWMAELERRGRVPSSKEKAIRELLPRVGADPDAGRRCFELLKNAAGEMREA
jgi:GxGYxYP putative glycoside hydrolase C-terminal domain/GxGYxYP third domain